MIIIFPYYNVIAVMSYYYKNYSMLMAIIYTYYIVIAVLIITRPNTLISYFTTYLIHYSYNSKTRGDRQKRTSDSESTSKNIE